MDIIVLVLQQSIEKHPYHSCIFFFIFAVEFLLDSASVYAPTDTVSLENVMFLFRVSPGKEEIVAHGFDDIGKAKFAVYASLVGENEVTIEGTSGQTATSGKA